MKNLELTLMGVHEMSTLEMKETDGGFIWLLVVAGVLMLGTSSCIANVQMQIGGQNNTSTLGAETKVDSTLNGNTVKTSIECP